MDTILYPIVWVISWILYGVHQLLTVIGFSQESGPAWVLSIVGMTIVIRTLTIPLFNKQTRASRAGQELNPEIQKIQRKYKGRTDQVSKQRQQEELMALYREHGTSPFASCLPALIQMPIFFSLYRLLNSVLPISLGNKQAIGPIKQSIASDIAHSTFFGAPLSSAIGTAHGYPHPTRIIVVAVILISLMIITLFFTQRQIMTKNLPESAMDPSNPAYKMQKYMLYGMPLIYIFSGAFFQVGVLVYWLTGNFWTIGQQTWLITTNPAPGSVAYKKRQAKLREKRIQKGLPPEEDAEASSLQTGQRVQPMGKARSKKARKAANSPFAVNDFEQNNDSVSEESDEEVRGIDGLTDAERARKRYERRLAERQRSKEKKAAKAKRQQQNRKNRNF
ncbi:membrane protein insertase YidC [Trueperella sp. LYQ143]|uniref:membrane protein insertase YidC n=1 Tax=Trueperella sp. LYQ143 TaxID=3391059 RepID=UPI003983C25E